MTARQAFESLLTELSKVSAPSMLILDFNYFINKAINSYINKRYTIYDISLQTTDDLRVLKATAVLDAKEQNSDFSDVFGATYEIHLPLDYLHILNCICIYELKDRFKCHKKGDKIQIAAKRLTADSWSSILNNFYNKPTPERPYYYINNINTSVQVPTNPINDKELKTDSVGTDSKLPRKINLKDIKNKSLVNKEAGQRYGNASSIRCEIRYGDNSKFELKKVFIDYIKTPLIIRLTQQQVNLTEDTSQILEFPDYVCLEIINELVTLVMENVNDPRLQTYAAVTQSIANPAQQLTQK